MSFGKDLKKIIAGPMAGVIFPIPHPDSFHGSLKATGSHGHRHDRC
jgi:hypothetical protein